jgi:hypothetical protein
MGKEVMAEVPAALRAYAERLRVKAVTNRNAAALLPSFDGLIEAIERDDHPSIAAALADQAIGEIAPNAAATKKHRERGDRTLRSIIDDPDNLEFRRKHPNFRANAIKTTFAVTSTKKYGVGGRQLYEHV